MEKSLFTAEYTVLRRLLRERREAAGVTQVALAERLNETQSYVSKVERGERRLDLVQLQVICRVLGTDLSEFVAEYSRATARLRGSRGRGR
jgi:transcriptional regulator with XRE-family HTH domain